MKFLKIILGTGLKQKQLWNSTIGQIKNQYDRLRTK